ncbi:MAG: DUF192 domain-containing protein [Halorientalis sp.]
MRVVHERDGKRRPLATTVDVADSFLSQTLGLMGQSAVSDDYALVFEFGDPGFFYRLRDTVPRRVIHMLFVRMPLDVLWLRDGEVVKVATLSPWTGVGVAKADTIVELAAGSADGVDVGDTVLVEREDAAEPAATDGESATPAGGSGDAAAADGEPTTDGPG